MTTYARVSNGIVAELIELLDDSRIADHVHPSLVAEFVIAPPEVRQGWLYEDGAFSAPPQLSEPSLEEVKLRLKSRIDSEAETERLKYITPGAGQAMTYQQKAVEAALYLAAEDPHANDYPMLSAEVGITANDLAGVAAVVNSAYKNWQLLGAAIEAVRLGTKAEIDKSTTVDEAQSLAASVAWP